LGGGRQTIPRRDEKKKKKTSGVEQEGYGIFEAKTVTKEDGTKGQEPGTTAFAGGGA